MTIHKIFGVFGIVLLLIGCSSAEPNYINGRYYMAGDSACARGKVNQYGSLDCYTSKNEYTGSRRPISEMQAKAWYDYKNSSSSGGGRSYKPSRQTFCNNIAGVVMCNSI